MFATIKRMLTIFVLLLTCLFVCSCSKYGGINDPLSDHRNASSPDKEQQQNSQQPNNNHENYNQVK